MDERIRFILVGSSQRSEYLYFPLFQKLSEYVHLVGIWGRSLEKTRALGEKYNLPWSTHLDQLIDRVKPKAAVVSVGYSGNGEVGKLVTQAGLHALLETPIAHELADADAIISIAQEKKLKIEVAEQYFRRPMERIKRALIEAGVFGKVFTAFNDFMGHGYHGVSLVRSYVSFDVPVVSVNASTAQFTVGPHHAWISKSDDPRTEQWEQGMLHFADGRLGLYSWSSIAYDSPLRWQRSTRFFAERGMAVGDQLTLLTKDGRDPQPIFIERRFHNVGGMETLDELVAHTSPLIIWCNPFRGIYMDDEMIAVADCLMSLVDAIRENKPVEYGPIQARTDQAVVLAMAESASNHGNMVYVK